MLGGVTPGACGALADLRKLMERRYGVRLNSLEGVNECESGGGFSGELKRLGTELEFNVVQRRGVGQNTYHGHLVRELRHRGNLQ